MVRKWRNKGEIPTPQTEGWEKNQMTFRHLYRKPSEQLFPNRLPFSYPNLTKNMKTQIRLRQHTNSTPKHKTIRTTTAVSPWKDQ